jgi:hypothetical protein
MRIFGTLLNVVKYLLKLFNIFSKYFNFTKKVNL